MDKSNKDILGLIPARGGSKSIPLKNLVPLNGHPLISYVINAARHCSSIDRIICSTDNKQINEVCKDAGIGIADRPEELARDETNVIDVMIDLLNTLQSEEGYVPFAVVLLQPTSPFILPKHIDHCVNLLLEDETAESVQTISKFPHNYHAFNQRIFDSGFVNFRFLEERRICYNKQTKPEFYKFGNLVITRTGALCEDRQVFAQPSLGYEVPFYYAHDLDGPDDLEMAEWYIERGKVSLQHMI